MDNATIQEFLDEHDYDIRKTHNGRWIDQKCTMDVVCLVYIRSGLIWLNNQKVLE